MARRSDAAAADEGLGGLGGAHCAGRGPRRVRRSPREEDGSGGQQGEEEEEEEDSLQQFGRARGLNWKDLASDSREDRRIWEHQEADFVKTQA